MSEELAISPTPGSRRDDRASSVAVASMAWVFTQSHPLGIRDVTGEAKKRGCDLDEQVLRELYRYGLLAPFVYINSRQVGPIPEPVASEPRIHGTRQGDLRYARDRGRLMDLSAAPFRPRLRFEGRADDSRGWWNGLIYSRFQLLIAPDLRGLLAQRRVVRRGERVVTRLPKPADPLVARAEKLRRVAIALTALEGRYLPKLDAEWLQLVNTTEEEWRAYCTTFDPVTVSRRLGCSATQVRQDAEWLLLRAHDIDPISGAWNRLVRRSPRRAWKDLKDAALIAMDYREAAELLLLFYEDLVEAGEAEALPVIPTMSWHPLHERLSYRPETLDQNLMQLGVSPHPRVVLAIEGDTEQVHAPLVWRTLGYPEAPELMRLLKLGTVDRDLEKVAALAVAPLIEAKIKGHEAWSLIKPPTRLVVAVDPEGHQFGTEEKIAKTRSKILMEIKAVLQAQGVIDANPDELEELVRIRTWSASCYEFAHFSDEELADGISEIHETLNGWTREQLIERLAAERRRRKDIKEAWS